MQPSFTTKLIVPLVVLLSVIQSGLTAPPVPLEKRILYIRIDFPDLRGDPVPIIEIQKTLQQVHAYYLQNSYGQLSLKFTIVPTRRMPHPAAFYDSNPDDQKIIRDARAAAKALGYDTDKFDYDIVAFKTLHGGDSGLSAVGGKGQRLLNNFRLGVHLHEFGHNLGLPHSNLWVTHDDTVLGPGQALDFGDIYDPMGGGGDETVMRRHLCLRSKALLGWLGGDKLLKVTQSGIYRIYAQDNASGPSPKGLLISRDADQSYWVEFRQQIYENPLMMNGVRILRSYNSLSQLDLLDMTPGSPGASGDAPLVIGRSFDDDDAGIHIMPIGKGRTQPESMDVLVNIGPAPTNNPPPTLLLRSSAQTIQAGQVVEFRTSVSSSNSELLNYMWDFGDGVFDWGKTAVTHRWAATNRDFLVRCIVADGKGGVAHQSQAITIGQAPTRPIIGSVMANGQPVADVLVQTDPGNTTLSDSDGKFSLVGLKPGKHRLMARKTGYVFQGLNVDSLRPEPVRFVALPARPDSFEKADGLQLEGRERFETTAYFKPPVEFSVVAKTDSTDLRFAYAADYLIFNWADDPTFLRMEGGVAAGLHKRGAGSIPVNQDVTIRWVVTEKRQSVYVNNELRFEHEGNYAPLNRPLAIFTHGNAKVTVKLVKARSLPAGK